MAIVAAKGDVRLKKVMMLRRPGRGRGCIALVSGRWRFLLKLETNRIVEIEANELSREYRYLEQRRGLAG